jgi:DNA end-binding protein Ku
MATKKAGPALVTSKPSTSITAPVADGKSAHKTWSGQIVIGGALSVPVLMYTAGRAVGFSFNQLHRACGNRLKQGKMHCPNCDVDVQGDDIVKGFPIDEKAGKYLRIEKEELKACVPASTDMMELIEFVDADSVPPIYFETSYYLSPDDGLNRKTFNTIWTAMRQAKVVGLVKLANHSRQHHAFLVPSVDDKGRPGMYAFYAFMADEIQQINFPSATEVNPAEVAVAGQVIEAMRAKFDPMKYKDEYRENVEAMLNAKMEGKEVPTVVERKLPAAEVNLEAALKVALEAAKKRKKAS